MKNFTIWLIGPSIFTAMILASCFWYQSYQPHAGVEQAVGSSIKVASLMQEFAIAKPQAEAKYMDQLISVSGVLTQIIDSPSGMTILSLDSGDERYGIDCHLASPNVKQLDKLKIGSEITVKGICTDKSVGINLRQCIITPI